MFPSQPKVCLLFKIKRKTSKAIKKIAGKQVKKKKENIKAIEQENNISDKLIYLSTKQKKKKKGARP